MNKIIVCNSCVGHDVAVRIDPSNEYNTPFIGTFIPNDCEYIKLCNNIMGYMMIDPIVNTIPKDNTPFHVQNGRKIWIGPTLANPYPIIHIEDIEIHCVHETDCSVALEKFNRRRHRMIDLYNTGNYSVICMLSFSELFNNHVDTQTIIDSFLKINQLTPKISAIFMGPTRFKHILPHYIIADKYETVELRRKDGHVYAFNDQLYNIQVFYDYIVVNQAQI